MFGDRERFRVFAQIDELDGLAVESVRVLRTFGLRQLCAKQSQDRYDEKGADEPDE